MFLFKIYINLVKRKVIFDPFKAFARCFKFRKVVVSAVLNAYNRSYHGIDINNALVGNRGYPAGCSLINMSVSKACRSCADADKRSVHTAAENRRSFF